MLKLTINLAFIQESHQAYRVANAIYGRIFSFKFLAVYSLDTAKP